jgi:hypothetical protein
VAFTSTPTSKVRSLGTPERKKPLGRIGFGVQQLEKSYKEADEGVMRKNLTAHEVEVLNPECLSGWR